MTLQPGRMEGIVEHLQDDYNVFPCHKTTQHDEDEDGEPITVPNPKEQACAGALAYMHKHHSRLPVLARLAIRAKDISLQDIVASAKLIEEPGKWPTN